MPSAAYATITGHITAPKTRSTPTGTTVLEFSVPVNNPRDDNDTAWFRISVFGKQAETLDRLQLAKGTLVQVQGRLTPRTWQKDGVPQTSLDVAADAVLLLSKRDQAEPMDLPF